jgi:hypothetical protein
LVCNAEKYIYLLISANIIKRFGGYEPGDHAWKYCFTDFYQSHYVPSELTNQKLLRRIREANTKKGREETRYYPKQKQQLKTMTINYDNAIELIKKQFPDNVRRYNYAVGQVTRIINKDFYLIQDDSGHRVHTPLSNLVKFLRSEIQIDGKYLSGLDIGNSQLYFAIKILLDPESVKIFFPGHFYLMMLKCLRLSKQQDVAKFVLLTSKAQFYKFMEAEFIKAGLHIEVIDPIKVSNKVKKIVFTILFEPNHLTSKAKKIFQKNFPNVDKAFSVLRMVNYTDFVNCLARMESFAVNEIIIARMNTEDPGMIAQQIYDNMVTSIVADDIETARRITGEELTKFVGYPPVLRIEKFRPNANI